MADDDDLALALALSMEGAEPLLEGEKKDGDDEPTRVGGGSGVADQGEEEEKEEVDFGEVLDKFQELSFVETLLG